MSTKRKRESVKDKRPRSRKNIYARLPRSLSQRTNFFNTKMFAPVYTATQAVTVTTGSQNYQLDQFSGYAAYASVFDQYKIDKVEVRFIPKCISNDLTVMAAAGTKNVPCLYTCIDHDDSNTPANIAEIMENNSCIVVAPMKEHKRTFKPMIAKAAYSSGAFTGYSASEPDWLDCASDDIEHYGLKWAMDGGGVSQTTFQIYDIFISAWVSFRATH